MSYDPAVPLQLKRTQQWFASIIERPIDEEDRMNLISPSGQPMRQEACDYISPSPTLRPEQRIELYNQQYWWRLLKTMQESFPLVLRLFGYSSFNQLIATPYLVKYPSNHWSLLPLGDRLPQWIASEYHAEDKPLVSHAALVDCAFLHAFVCHQFPPIASELAAQDQEHLLNQKLVLQPYVHLFELPYDLFQFRVEFLKQKPEYWIENDFPPLEHLEQPLHFVLYRNANKNVSIETVSLNEFLTLRQYVSGMTIDSLCQWLETQPHESALYQEASQNLHLWFQNWIARQWLGCE